MSPDLLQMPLPDRSTYNEFAPDGVTPRAYWSTVIESLQGIGPDELARRWERAERRIRENGVTYNVYTDPQGVNRPLAIDPIPLLIPPEEWRVIEAGIVQRAHLLNLLVGDIYGPRQLIQKGDLPADLLFANPSFLRPLTGVAPPDRGHLHLIGVDLARSPDGRWWVLADRTQSPSGTGYALQNRTIVADALPEAFSAANVRRLASFFRTRREALLGLARCDHPRAVLLTPGPYNETYFEHSYLARYLGLTLAEGSDLTVRDRRVYLKTVEGLQPVHVILRRVDDSFCDPMELRHDSFLGVAGLVDAVHAGNVVVVNALGSGVIETAAIMPFLPGLAEKLLGEPLKLPSVATWWCGQDYALDWVLDHLDRVVVKPAFPSRAMEPVFGADLSRAEKRKISEQLRSRPYEYVAQEQVDLSTVPVWDQGRLNPHSMVLRTYALNTGGGWIAMPGGLVRVSEADGQVVSMQRGGRTKDAWVLWDGPVDTFSLLRPRNQPVQLERAAADLPSRAADNLFWLGRYAERSECIARLLRCLMTRVRRANRTELACLFRLHGCLVSTHSTLPKDRPATEHELEDELVSLMSAADRPDSLASYLAEVRRVGGSVRERLSTDMSRLVAALSESAQTENYMLFVEYSAVLNGCLELLSAFSGMERENITRGPGWLFLSLGRRLERAMYSVRQLRELTSGLDERSWPLLEYLLEVADSSMTYRSRYFTTLQPIAVLDVLMADESNPRSLSFQIVHLADLYKKLTRHVPADREAIQHAAALLRGLDLEKVEFPLPGGGLPSCDSDGQSQIHRTLGSIQKLLPSWADNISLTYFDHAHTFPISIGE
ncbi:MAG: circularly permuted type 2 ATP-grasp protein [Candidatus Sulfopaludibacter sp.]|nr:circularly permuted type 2 ATP-grasp protein [Candidatus Sulfopaludibacter sp.]